MLIAVAGRNTLSRVTNPHAQVVVGYLIAQGHDALVGKLHGIVHILVQYLEQPVAVGRGLYGVGQSLNSYLDTRLLASFGKLVGHFGQQLVEVEAGHLDRISASFQF